MNDEVLLFNVSYTLQTVKIPSNCRQLSSRHRTRRK